MAQCAMRAGAGSDHHSRTWWTRSRGCGAPRGATTIDACNRLPGQCACGALEIRRPATRRPIDGRCGPDPSQPRFDRGAGGAAGAGQSRPGRVAQPRVVIAWRPGGRPVGGQGLHQSFDGSHLPRVPRVRVFVEVHPSPHSLPAFRRYGPTRPGNKIGHAEAHDNHPVTNTSLNATTTSPPFGCPHRGMHPHDGGSQRGASVVPTRPGDVHAFGGRAAPERGDAPGPAK